ncbi:DHA2 family multidrug resistance protein-like MFS transporter [Catenulispora sp. MAP12-49]|uniref:MFS transporter n=1 Tax=Catenulispora sp. MAP12-49 TaxID=3156302 RepID=UPI003519352A
MQDATSGAASGTPAPAAVARAGRKEWVGLAVLALPALLVAMDIGALFLALPHLSSDLGVTGAQQLWVTDIYGFMLAGFLPTMGTLGDRVGRRRLLLIGATFFTLTSLFAAYSTNGTELIAARALLGVAGASLSPSTLALISTMFHDPKQQKQAIGIWSTCLFGGTALGPVIGGVMLEYFWWGSVFLLGVPVMVLLLAVGPKALPEFRNPDAGRLDYLSVLMSLGAVLPVVWGVKEFAAGGAANPVPAGAAIVAGLVVGVLFVRRQGALAHPMIDIGLFRRREFTGVLLVMSLSSLALAGMGIMSSQWIQSVADVSPGAAGLLQAPTGFGFAVGTALSAVLLKWFRPATTMIIGAALSAAAYLVITQAAMTGWLAAVVLCYTLAALGVGPTYAQGTGIVVGSVPQEKAGSAASLSETSTVFGSTLGLALLGSLGAAVYRHRVSAAALHAIPGVDAGQARKNVAVADGIAAGLPHDAAEALRHTAGTAFTTAMAVVALACAVICVGTALIARLLIRDLGPVPVGVETSAAPAGPAAPTVPEQDTAAAPEQDIASA